jgi:hypothetical protein
VAHGIEKIAGEKTLEFVAGVERGDEIEFVFVDGLQKIGDGIRKEVRGEWGDDDAGAGAEKIGGGEHGAENEARGILAGEIGGDAMDGAKRGEAAAIFTREGFKDILRGAVAVFARITEIDDGDALADKNGLHAFFDGRDEVGRGAGRVVGGDADDEIDFADAHELAKEVVR